MTEREFNPSDYGKPASAPEPGGQIYSGHGVVVCGPGPAAIEGIPPLKYVTDHAGTVWLLQGRHNYTRRNPMMDKTEQAGAENELNIEVTPEMVDAGVLSLEFWSGASRVTQAEAVFRAMLSVSRYAPIEDIHKSHP